MTTIDIKKVRVDGGTQMRTALDDSVIADYAAAYQANVALPAVIVFYDGSDYWLGDGFHRHAAQFRCGFLEIDVEVRAGTRRDAVLYACGANAKHGLRRSREDIRLAVKTLLADPEWGSKSDRWIAEHAGTTHTTVGKIRAEMAPAATGNVSISPTRTGQDGKERKVPERKPSAAERTRSIPGTDAAPSPAPSPAPVAASVSSDAEEQDAVAEDDADAEEIDAAPESEPESTAPVAVEPTAVANDPTDNYPPHLRVRIYREQAINAVVRVSENASDDDWDDFLRDLDRVVNARTFRSEPTAAE